MKMSDAQRNKKREQYLMVRELYKTGERSVKNIATFLGKSPQWVWMVVAGRGTPGIESLHLPDLVHTDPQKVDKQTNNK